jgi:hypothetical protein
MTFQINFIKLTPPSHPDESGAVFEVSLTNARDRRARIVSYQFELWQIVQKGTNGCRYLSQLRPDLRLEFPSKFEPEQRLDLKLIWLFTSEMLQHIEEARAGDNVGFQMRVNLGVGSIWKATGDKWHPMDIDCEHPYGPNPGGGGLCYPIFIDIAASDWSTFLSGIGFRHLSLEKYATVKMPSEFIVPEAHLIRAWDHHRNNRPDESLQYCFRAFECLGFNLYNDDKITRSDLVKNLLQGESKRKIDEVEKLFMAMTGFFHLGRHERGTPVDVDCKDSELALICASSLMSYFAKCKP